MRRAVVAILTVVGMIVGGIVAGLGWWVARGPTRPTLLIQGLDGNLLVADPRGRLTPLTSKADGRRQIYAFPAPGPDGQQVAYVETVHGTQTVTSSLVVQPLNGERRSVFASVKDRPFYLHWSPDGQQIAFLTSDGQDMTLRMINTNGEPQARMVTPGQPSYFAWTPDSRRLLLHTGGAAPNGTISVYALGDEKPRKWTTLPGLFQAPAWLDEGRSALAVVTTADGSALARIDDDGKIQQQVANAERGMIFVPAPGGKQVAYMPIGARLLGNLHLVGSDGSGKREIETGPALAALWSPDGQSIAYITFASDEEFKTTSTRIQESPTLEWHILDVATGHSRALTRFVPSEEFFNLLPFFDQYAQSIRLWDRMSRRLVYADNGGVWTLDVQTGEATNVAPGVIGLWLER